MMSSLLKSERDALLLHGLFSLIALAVLLFPGELAVGIRLSGVVILYNVMVPVWALRRNHPEWIRLWLFLLPLSILQIFPDAFLASVLGVLVFPDTGSPSFANVPLFMGGMWVIPLFIIVLIGKGVEARFTRNHALLAVCCASAVVFLGSESVLWTIPIWYARDVMVVAHIALYLVIPEILLGLFTYGAFELFHRRSFWLRLGAAFTVMVVYLGNLCLFYLLIERLIFSAPH
ncbi:MAG: hypothetical protein RRA35_09430 [Desulfomonilia bacterium]|nr:hypothetical protein [Desulfomonilia bacterium]